MNTKIRLMLGVTAAAFLMAVPAMADTQAVTQKTSTVNPDGSVSYQSKTVVSQVPPAATATTTTTVVSNHPVTFYYYEPASKHIVAESDLTPDIISLWDTDHNKVIDNHEFYNNAMVVYEPLEYGKRTYQDVNQDGKMELTREEYTVRLQKLPYYGTVNTDKKEGLTLYEFTGIGFREADLNNDNQVSFDEIRKAFYGQARLASEPTLYNN